MKYHKHEIKRINTDLGESQKAKNCVFQILKNGEYIATALTVSTAKEYIDSGYNDNYL